MNAAISKYIENQKVIETFKSEQDSLSDELGEIVWEKWLLRRPTRQWIYEMKPFKNCVSCLDIGNRPRIYEIDVEKEIIEFDFLSGDGDIQYKIPFAFFDNPDEYNKNLLQKIEEKEKKEAEEAQKMKEKRDQEEYERLKKKFEQ